MEQEVIRVKKPRAKFEWIIIIVILVASLVVSFGIYRKRDEAAKGRLMIYELANIRQAVMIYLKLNRNLPPSLAALAKLKFTFEQGDQPRAYLQNIAAGPEGEFIDPFGNSYRYDARSGWVASATEGFENY